MCEKNGALKPIIDINWQHMRQNTEDTHTHTHTKKKMQHITSACFIAGAARSLFWDDIVLIFVGSGFCNGTSRLGHGNPAGGMSLNDLELSVIDIVNLQKQDPKFSTISSEDPCIWRLHLGHSKLWSSQCQQLAPVQHILIPRKKKHVLDAFSSYRPIS